MPQIDSLIQNIRKDFPILDTKVYNKPLVYLDNAATTQKPVQVLDRLNYFYRHFNANIHRGVHYLSEQATSQYGEARGIVKNFLSAKKTSEIVFTSGATESINLVAFSFAEQFIRPDDEVIVSELEHHANIVPWQLACERKKARLRVIPINEKGELILDELPGMLNEKTKIIAVNQVSNTLGSINPVKQIIDLAHKHDIPVLVDGAQAVLHQTVDVNDLDCDFYVFSGHKIFGPTGIGILYGKEKWLEKMPPYQSGGDMIDHVSFEKTSFNSLPFKFEAGTSNYAGAIGLGEALQYVLAIGFDKIKQIEDYLLKDSLDKLSKIDGLKFIGSSENKISVHSFVLDGIHPYDAGMIFDKLGIAVRTGTHCTEPIMDHFNISGTIRASFTIYNSIAEIDALISAIKKVQLMLA